MRNLLGVLLATTRTSGQLVREMIAQKERNLEIVTKTRADDVQTIIDRSLQDRADFSRLENLNFHLVYHQRQSKMTHAL